MVNNNISTINIHKPQKNDNFLGHRLTTLREDFIAMG